MHFHDIKQKKILPMQADNKSSRLSLDSWRKILGEIHGSRAIRIRVSVNSNFSPRFLWEFFDSSANLRNSNDFDSECRGMRDIHRKL